MAERRRFYLDTNTVIAMIERRVEPTPAQNAFLDRIDAGEVEVVSNEVALLECLVRPLREKDAALTRTILGFFDSGQTLMVPLSRRTILAAAQLRADLRLTLADAFHVACAAEAGCTVFLSADRRLRVPDGMTRLGFDELALR